MTLHWHRTLTAKELKNVVARIAKSPEFNQHVFVGTRCLADNEKVKAGEVNIVMTFISSRVEAVPCRVSVNRKVVRCKVKQDVASRGRVDAGTSFGGASGKSADDECKWLCKLCDDPVVVGSHPSFAFQFNGLQKCFPRSFVPDRRGQLLGGGAGTDPYAMIDEGTPVGAGKVRGGGAGALTGVVACVPMWYSELKAWVKQYARLPSKKASGCSEAALVERSLAWKYSRERQGMPRVGLTTEEFDELKCWVKRYATSSHGALIEQEFADVDAWILQNNRLPSRAEGGSEAIVYATFAKLWRLRQAPKCELTALQCDWCDAWSAWVGGGKLLGGGAGSDTDVESCVPHSYRDMKACVGQHVRLPSTKPSGCNEAASAEKGSCWGRWPSEFRANREWRVSVAR